MARRRIAAETLTTTDKKAERTLMADSGMAGTSVTLVVPPSAVTPNVGTPAPPPPHHLPFSGFDLTTGLVLAALLLAAGALLLITGRRPTPWRTS
jgi:hypothetical protein